MMLERLRLRNFRGIKDNFDLEPDGENLALVGPNGSGKSSIVAAIDFLLTGKIRDLRGEGTARLTEKRHGPFIGADEDDAWVEADFSINGDNFTYKRTFAERKNPDFEGVKPLEFEALEAAADRGLHYLSRNEILDFIAAKAKTRSDQIRDLLHLQNIDVKRRALDNATDSFDAKYQRFVREEDAIWSELSNLIETDVHADAVVLAAVNEHREKLGGESIGSLEIDNFRQGIDSPAKQVRHSELLASDSQNLVSNIHEWFTNGLDDFFEALSEYHEKWDDVRANEDRLRVLNRLNLLERGREQIDSEIDECPLCQEEWDPNKLKAKLDREIEEARTLADEKVKLSDLSDDAQAILTKYRVAAEHLTEILGPYDAFDRRPIKSFAEDIECLEDSFDGNVLDGPPEYETPKDELKAHLNPDDVRDSIDKLTTFIEEEPDLEELERWWENLGSIQTQHDRIEKLKKEITEYEVLKDQVRQIHSEFIFARDEILNQIYEEISGRVKEYYSYIHGDETDLDFEFEPTESGLEIEVGFYEQGHYPPHALHSEGHQDSMGVCLYFALADWMREESGLTLMMLDDVVMSVDKDHRRQIADLMANELSSNYQLVITTHDDDWHRHLRSMGVVKPDNVTQFIGWSIEDGPRIPGKPEIEWETIDDLLEEGNTSAAAHQTRRLAEWFLRESADMLGAKVEFKSNGDYTLGDFQNGVKSKFSDLVRKAKKSRNSWDRDVSDVDALNEKRKRVFEMIDLQGRKINPNVHYNESDRPFADISIDEFRPVVEAFRHFNDLLRCQNCNSFIKVLKDGQTEEKLTCMCGEVDFNLLTK